MIRRKRGMVFSVFGAMLVAIIAGSTAPVRAQDTESTLSTTLSGPPINGVFSRGSAEYDNELPTGKFKAELQNVNLPNGTVLVISVSNPLPAGGGLATAMTLSGGQAQVQLLAPGLILLPGDIVRVTSVDGTITYLSGTLQ